MLLMIDNYDSFTYNLVQYFGELGEEVEVVRNDEFNVDQLCEKAPDYLVVSPGPGTPQQAGISVETIRAFSGKIPILGVCLGHQSIGEAFGGETVHAKTLMHGKTDRIFHQGESILEGMPDPFIATRYHSLVVNENDFPSCLKATAFSEAGEMMALSHIDEPTIGVQFHPESISTEKGHHMLQNFLDLA
jgi:anthranilate synthase/aminodeoxychorismate synthase-like glutamine amidotransferase